MSDNVGIYSSSGISGAASGESDRGVSGEMVDGLKSETLIENRGDREVLSGGVRVSGESKVLVGAGISGTEMKSVESGKLGISDKEDANRNRVVQNVARNNNHRWEAWGVMNMVGRVLDGKLCMDNEIDDVDDSKNWGGVKLVAEKDACQEVGDFPNGGDVNVVNEKDACQELDDSEQLAGVTLVANDSCQEVDDSTNRGEVNDACQDVIGEPASENRIDIKSAENWGEVNLVPEKGACQDVNGDTTSENRFEIKSPDIVRDPVKPYSSCPAEGSGLNGNEYLNSQETVPNGILKTEEVVEAEEEFNDMPEVLIPKARGEHDITEKEGEYYVSDLVWGKVRSHPWWPGQIFSPLSASDNAAIHLKMESYLVAYFGDQTFAWIEGSKIKPFRKYFSEMEKQSHSDRYSHGVQCALEEAGRRVEFGLSCSCLPVEVHDAIKYQVVENGGVSKESSRIVGGDNLSGAATFLPGDVLQFVQSLAASPQSKPDRLHFTIAKAQLMSYNRWKGHYQLPVFEVCGRPWEDATQLNLTGVMGGVLPVPVSEVGNGVSSRKRKSTAKDASLHKRKRLSGDEEGPKIKEKSLSDLMSSGSSGSQNSVKRTKNVVSSGEKQVGVDSMASNSKGKRGRKRKSLLSTSPGGESKNVQMIPPEIPTPDIVLRTLILAAKKPMEGHNSMIPVLGLLRGFRNSICPENSVAVNVQINRDQQSDFQTADIPGAEGTEDVYWTDRIIQGYSQDTVLFGSQKFDQGGRQAEAVVPNMDDYKERIEVANLDAEGPSAVVNEESADYRPTALILNFSNLESIPSVENLNEIFRPYGPLNENETKILTKGKRARVTFKRREDAETAFSSTGKYSIFGPALVSYRLHFFAQKPQKIRATSKQNKKSKLPKDNSV